MIGKDGVVSEDAREIHGKQFVTIWNELTKSD